MRSVREALDLHKLQGQSNKLPVPSIASSELLTMTTSKKPVLSF
jgi:hypothetical protein